MHDEKFDEPKGTMKEFGGKVQQGAGEFMGDEEMQAKGEEKETEGKVQKVWGKAKGLVGDAVDTVKDAFDPNNKDPEKPR